MTIRKVLGVILIILGIAIFVSLITLAACRNEESHDPLASVTDGITYEIQDSAVTILNISATDTYLTIPSYIEGLPVEKIGSQFLYQNTTCINLVFPETLETIESAAFYRCYSLTEIEIPKSVSNIGSGAFFRCASLLNIRVDKDNAHFQDIDGVLYSKDGKVLLAYPEGRVDSFCSIPEGVTTIADDAFGYHSSLRYVYIPDSVVNFPDYNIFLFPDEITIIASDNGAARKYADQYGIRWQAEIPE